MDCYRPTAPPPTVLYHLYSILMNNDTATGLQSHPHSIVPPLQYLNEQWHCYRPPPEY